MAIATLIASTIISTPVSAGAPQQLQGKSIVISWSETRNQRDERPGGSWTDYRDVRGSHKLSIYVSTQGRVFSRLRNTTRSGSGSNEQVAGEQRASPGRVPSFNGTTMTIIGENRGGTRRTVVDFDAGFASCTATVALAFEEGKTSVSMSPITKRKVEIKSVNIATASCAVESGNVLGDGST